LQFGNLLSDQNQRFGHPSLRRFRVNTGAAAPMIVPTWGMIAFRGGTNQAAINRFSSSLLG
jgi:hypothetical protein